MDIFKRGINGKNDVGDKKNSYLMVVLVLLCLVIIVLGGVAVVNLVKNQSSEGETGELSYDDTEEKQTRTMLESYDDLYRDGKHDEALMEYQNRMDEAVKNEDYDMYLRLFSSRDMMLQNYDGCEDILKSYDNLKIDDLPAGVRVNVYSTAAITSEECGDYEKQAYYENELQKIFDSGEVNRDESDQ